MKLTIASSIKPNDTIMLSDSSTPHYVLGVYGEGTNLMFEIDNNSKTIPFSRIVHFSADDRVTVLI
jgi:hypothetical protein